jgi:hypothetical protein
MWQLHIIAGDAHYIRLTRTKTRSRQVEKFKALGATVMVEEVDDEHVHPLAVPNRIIRVDGGGKNGRNRKKERPRTDHGAR